MVIDVRKIILALILANLAACSTPNHFIERGPAQVSSCAHAARGIIEGFQEVVSLTKAYKKTRPGQLTYGRPRVDYLRQRIQVWDFEEMQEYIDARPIPYVEDPSGNWVIHDRHHFLLAFFKEREDLIERFPGRSPKFTYQRTAGFKGQSWESYRAFMEKEKYVHLRFKGQPASWEDLPERLEDLQKDYFRGMAWVLVKAGIVSKKPVPFFEFEWAHFLRQRFSKLPTKWRLRHVKAVMQDILENPDDYRQLEGLDHEIPSLEEALENIEKYAIALGW